jgi:hypothetical protein
VSTAAFVLLAFTAASGLLLTGLGEQRRPAWGAVVLAGLLAVGTALAWAAGSAPEGVVQGSALAAVLAAVAGGGPVATAVLQAADPAATGVAGGPQDPEVLRGGVWIGLLERAAVAGTLLVGWPEGLALVLAVKGLGRFSELGAPAAAERFILGTFASTLWAIACVGVVFLVRS